MNCCDGDLRRGEIDSEARGGGEEGRGRGEGGFEEKELVVCDAILFCFLDELSSFFDADVQVVSLEEVKTVDLCLLLSLLHFFFFFFFCYCHY